MCSHLINILTGSCMSPRPSCARATALLLISALAFGVGCSPDDELVRAESETSSDSSVTRAGGDELMSDAETSSDQDLDAGLPEPDDAEVTPSEPDAMLDAEVLDAEIPPPDPGADLPVITPAQFVMNEVQLLPSTDGFDLDGDGVPNNALSLLFEDELVGGVLGGDPNDYIARSVRRGELLLLLDMHKLNDWRNDEVVDIDIFLGSDADSRRRNNFEGEGEFFVTCSSLTPEGEAGSRFTRVEIAEGAMSGDGGSFRFLISFAANTEVILRDAKLIGQVSADGQTITEGMLSGSIIYSELEEVVRNDPEIGSGFAQIMLNFISAKLDIDSDGDGLLDAMSASFRFAAVSANILRDQPCAEGD